MIQYGIVTRRCGALFMYMWLVLSTFLAILAGYFLPVRDDIAEKKDVPIASAHMMRMAVNQRIALNYVKMNKWPYYCAGASEGEVLTDCDDANKIGYSAGDVNPEEDYYQGFNYDEGYTSRIFCYDESNADSEGNDSCAIGVAEVRYLVTYGDLGSKWLTAPDLSESGGGSRVKVTPRGDVLKGFEKYFASEDTVGYVVEDEDSGKAYIINAFGKKVFDIPETMYDAMSGSNNCNKDFNGSCIMYLSKI